MVSLVPLLNSTELRVWAYVLAAAVAALAGVRSIRSGHRRSDWIIPGFWLAVGVLLAILALARFVSLGDRVADVGRSVFRTEGWYPDRRSVQQEAILVLLMAAAAIGVAGTALLVARRWISVLPAFMFVVALLTFVSVRAVSLHKVDGLLYRRSLLGITFSAATELLITALIALSAAIALLRARIARTDVAGTDGA